MTITFFSNFFNHHQKPVCDIFYEQLGNNFTFVSTIPMPESFAKGGYENYSKVSYNLLSYIGDKEYAQAKKLSIESDIAIYGPAPLEFVLDRMKANKHTFRYLERFFKKGNYQKFDYRIINHLLKYHTRYRNKNVYLLCASAYTANDFSWVYAYPKKKIKWGYFTEIDNINIAEVLKIRDDKKIKILFVARLIKLKHPELVIEMAKSLKSKDISFQLDIVGTGPMLNLLKSKVNEHNLEKNVIFAGNMPNAKVLKKMRSSHIFLFTSNRMEGWGAVLNEAMGNGCCVVASHVIGAAPFLIKNGENGLIFKSGNAKDLTDKVERLINDKGLREKIAINAYDTMKNIWSPENAAYSFLLLCKSLLNKENIEISEGPGSIANPTPSNWHKIKKI